MTSTWCSSQLYRAINTSLLHTSFGLFTFVHTTFPLEQWQVLQSSSHFTPSGVMCPLTEQGFLVTELNITTVLEIYQKWWVCYVDLSIIVLWGLIPSWQWGPVRSGGHKQRYPLISSTQVEPKAHGEDWHSLISVRGRARGKKWLLYEIKSTARQHTNIGLSSQHTNLIPRLNWLRSCVIWRVHTHTHQLIQ